MNTLIVSKTRSGAIAVLARINESSPWKQVESVRTTRDATVYVQQLEGSPEIRADAVYEWRAEDWGDDAPIVDPNQK